MRSCRRQQWRYRFLVPIGTNQTEFSFYTLSNGGVSAADIVNQLTTDVSNNRISVGNGVVIVPGSTVSCVSGCNDGSGGSSSLSGGAIAGIVIGCVVGVLLLCAIIYYLLLGNLTADKKAPPSAPAAMEMSSIPRAAGAYDPHTDAEPSATGGEAVEEVAVHP